MTNVEKIQIAEAKVAEMQDALTAMQSGLEKAEQLAIAAEETKAKADRILKAALGLIGLSVLLLVMSRRRPR